MKISKLLALSPLASLVVAGPAWYDWSRSSRTIQSTGLVGYAFDNPIGPTTGGSSGKTITVTSDDALVAELSDRSSPKTILLDGTFHPTARLRIGSNVSLIGKGNGANIIGQGINVNNVANVIIRNIGIRFVVDNDGMTIQNSTRVWVDHCEFESELSVELGPNYYDGQLDIVRASDWITISYNYFHDHWKSSLIGNSDTLRNVDEGTLHVTYHHNFWSNIGTRGPAGRFGHQHIYNNLYENFLYQAIHSRSDNQVLVEGNVFKGNTRTALTTYGLVIPEDSPNTCVCGDEELDGFANLGAENDFGGADVNITQVGNFTDPGYEYTLEPLKSVEKTIRSNVGLGKVDVDDC
ncbi:related to pectate lyase 1 [Ramularia collo-cygni]|uniref:Related to pectate lyase 1 n=1 Tax=Ramularia collo-cygni TaxID=112498 RepID=A0A2D3V7K8_9PEZI|nr:related to pectate lyase 1 [Ramularia collo-cygni]CZT18544.1 related to pectate lyase 1 [Ramularia collo-cygni]